MANTTLFQSLRGRLLPAPRALNHEAAPAYAFTDEHALAQYAATGCLSTTFYASAEMQLERVLALCEQVEPGFIAKTAVFAREQGYMKDMPALLCAVLSVRDGALLERVFPRVIDNGRMLRTFVQILRSGAAGRKSLGTRPKRLVQEWLAGQSEEAVFRASVGQSPSLADVVKMVHPRPALPARRALYGYLIGRDHDAAALPALVRQFEAYKTDRSQPVPDVPFQMLTALDLGRAEWTEIARNAPWHMTRMNLQTFARHGVFEDAEVTALVAERLRDRETIRRARAFPYQLLAAYRAAVNAPRPVVEALHDAMEVATENVPALPGKVYVCPDVSGSMTWASVTGHRKGATSTVRCVDVAALVAAAVLRRNPSAEVIPFEQDVVRARVDARDSVMTNAERLAGVGGGGTNCSAPLAWLNRREAKGDLVVFVSDNESWVDARRGGGATEMLRQWSRFKQRNPQARLVCLDLQPYATTQAPDREDILNIGGFSDQVFSVIDAFAQGQLRGAYFADLAERTVL